MSYLRESAHNINNQVCSILPGGESRQPSYCNCEEAIIEKSGVTGFVSRCGQQYMKNSHGINGWYLIT